MRILQSTLTLALTLAFIGACDDGGLTEEGVPLGDHLETVSSALSEAEAETTEHGMHVEEATDMEAVHSEEEGHHGHMMEHHAMMMESMVDMGECSHGDEKPMTADMAMALDAYEAEADAHEEAMMGAADMEAAHAEEEHHQDTMVGIMSDLEEAKKALEPDAGDFTCPAHGHEDEHAEGEAHEDGDDHAEGEESMGGGSMGAGSMEEDDHAEDEPHEEGDDHAEG